MDDFPHFLLAEDGRICSTGQHCLVFPQVLFDALLRLGYNWDVPIYCCRLSMPHGPDVCKVSMMIPFDPIEPWSGSIIGSEPNTTIEMMAHVPLTSLCESRLAATTTLPISLFLILNQQNPMWQQCLKAVANLEGPNFSASMAAMARYA
jgi:hypothetical protein